MLSIQYESSEYLKNTTVLANLSIFMWVMFGIMET